MCVKKVFEFLLKKRDAVRNLVNHTTMSVCHGIFCLWCYQLLVIYKLSKNLVFNSVLGSLWKYNGTLKATKYSSLLSKCFEQCSCEQCLLGSNKYTCIVTLQIKIFTRFIFFIWLTQFATTNFGRLLFYQNVLIRTMIYSQVVWLNC